MKKLLVCDIEGTIFKPHQIKSAQHASYIWTSIAEALGKDAEKEEIITQRKWRSGGYGDYNTGTAYIKWVNDSIAIHRKYHLNKQTFDQLIEDAPYYEGVVEFFSKLDRSKYIPVFVSGGIQNLNHKACRDLNVDYSDSYASCEYFFYEDSGKLNTELTFENTCDFFGKHELIQIALRRHGLGPNDWVFIGDGINDVSVASIAPLSIGISPVDELRDVATYSFDDFNGIMNCQELLDKAEFLGDPETNEPIKDPSSSKSFLEELVKQRVERNIGNLDLERLEDTAYHRFLRECGDSAAKRFKSRFRGIRELLIAGETSLALLESMSPETLVSAVLQPFCSASETMVNITLVTHSKSKNLYQILNSRYSLYQEIANLENPNLREVLNAYRANRNTIAHSYQSITIEAARALVRRTYENIQRMELLLNPYWENNPQ